MPSMRPNHHCHAVVRLAKGLERAADLEETLLLLLDGLESGRNDQADNSSMSTGLATSLLAPESVHDLRVQLAAITIIVERY